MGFPISAQILDYCVLAIVNREDVYGYSLTQQLGEAISLSESTLYPVLRRLKKEALVAQYDVTFEGRNRRYYKITEAGKERLLDYGDQWEAYVASVEKITKGGKNG